MGLKRNLRFVFIFILAAALLLIVALLSMRESRMCMGIDIVGQDYLADKQEISIDLRDYIFFEEEKVALDWGTNTIYISNQIEENTRPQDLKGKLTISLGEYELKWIHSEYMDNFAQSVKDNQIFTLAAVSPQGYMKYNVVFTTLPVIKIMTGEFMDMKGIREVWEGFVTMWSPYDESVGDFSTKTGRVKFNYRGATTYWAKKKNYRMTFINDAGEKDNISLLGLGEDDDWILNAMNMDDMRVKERVCMSLWNEYAVTTDYNYKMSQGEYVELVADGEYRGLYMLQRRVDPKYLGLSDNDILFKRGNVMEYTNAWEGYEVKNTPLTEEETYKIINDIFFNGNLSVIDAKNLADINLFMEMAHMGDNVLKNIYFVLRDTGDDYQMRFILWDTDMTFGIVWSPLKFIYNMDEALGGTIHRPETAAYSEINPQIYDMMAEKWAELRISVLTEENILGKLDECYSQITESGAYTREVTKWKCADYEGLDTKENMETFIRQKLKIMDEKYLQ